MMRHLHIALVLIFGLAASVAAQQPQTVRVTKDQAVIWQPNFSTIATIARVGTVLEVVARRGDWYEVVLPVPVGARNTGMIAVAQVELVGASSAPPRQAGGTAAPQAATSQRAAPPRPGPANHGFRLFVDAGYGWFDANRSFDALFGQPGGFSFGAGGQYRFSNGLFIEGSGEWQRLTGERVFVVDSEVFNLGISDTVTIIPVAATVGYRFGHHRVVPYLGGGAGQYFYKETFEFADPSEEVNRHFTSYHALGGFEWRASRWFGMALEVQYTHVPTDFTEGVAEAFNEQNLGGIQTRVKLLFGK